MVRGMTTCLFSKRAFKMLHGPLDSQADQCVLSRVQSGPILLQTTPTGLYLINLLDIYQKDEIAFSHEEPHTCLSKSSQTQLRDGGSVGDLSELSKNKKIWGSVVGVSQLMQDSPVQSKKFMRARDFRSKAPVAQFPKSSSVGCHHAANGHCAQDHCRSPDQASHPVAADPSAAVGETGSLSRDSPTGGHTGSPQGGSLSPEERTREEGSSSGHGHSNECGIRQFNSVDKTSESDSGPAKEPCSFHCFPGSKLARDRSRGGDIQKTALTQSRAPVPGNLTLSEWGSNVINFGRKHKG